MKKDCWSVLVDRRSILKVIFDKPITKEEATFAVLNDEYEDIIDEADLEIKEVLRIE